MACCTGRSTSFGVSNFLCDTWHTLRTCWFNGDIGHIMEISRYWTYHGNIMDLIQWFQWCFDGGFCFGEPRDFPGGWMGISWRYRGHLMEYGHFSIGNCLEMGTMAMLNYQGVTWVQFILAVHLRFTRPSDTSWVTRRGLPSSAATCSMKTKTPPDGFRGENFGGDPRNQTWFWPFEGLL